MRLGWYTVRKIGLKSEPVIIDDKIWRGGNVPEGEPLFGEKIVPKSESVSVNSTIREGKLFREVNR